MAFPSAFSYRGTRWFNVGQGVNNRVYVPNHTQPTYSQLGFGRQVLRSLRIVEGPEIVYQLAVSYAPVTGAGQISGTVEQTPLQMNLLNPVGPPMVPAQSAVLDTTPSF